MGRGEIGSVNGIERLTKLKDFKLDSSVYELSDLSELAGLRMLEKLELSKQKIVDLSSLRNQKALKEIRIVENQYQIKSLEPLKNHKNLKVLDISIGSSSADVGKKIKNVDSLKYLKNLESISLSRCGINNIWWMKSLTRLKDIDLSWNSIANISSLRGLKSIESIDLSNNMIKDISPINSKENLKNLNLSSNKISEMPSKLALKKIEVLNLSQNSIGSLNFGITMPEIIMLDVSSNRLKTIGGMDNLANVEQLYLGANRIFSIDFLENMKRLKVLFIGSNRLTNFDVIAGMSYLEELGFEGNEITDVSSLYSLKNLKVMSIDGKYVDETVNVSKTGVPIIVYHVSLGGMGGATHRSVIKEFVLPFGKRAMNYEFAVDNIRHSGRNSYIIEVESGDPRYELIIEKEYAIPCVDEDIEQKNWDIEVIEKAKISGKIVLGDRLLSVENKDYLEREIAIYARINDEKRRAICLGKVDQNEFEYELYLPKAYKGQAFTLEYAVKDYGHFDFRAHFGTIGNMIYNGFLQLDGMLSPNGDDAGRVQFDGGDMVIEDVFVEI